MRFTIAAAFIGAASAAAVYPVESSTPVYEATTPAYVASSVPVASSSPAYAASTPVYSAGYPVASSSAEHEEYTTTKVVPETTFVCPTPTTV